MNMTVQRHLRGPVQKLSDVYKRQGQTGGVWGYRCSDAPSPKRVYPQIDQCGTADSQRLRHGKNTGSKRPEKDIL